MTKRPRRSAADVERTESRAQEERVGVAVGRHRLQVHARSRYSTVLVGAAWDSTSSPIPPSSTGNPSLARCNDINASCRPVGRIYQDIYYADMIQCFGQQVAVWCTRVKGAASAAMSWLCKEMRVLRQLSSTKLLPQQSYLPWEPFCCLFCYGMRTIV
uniref:Uncharacterized protein n=1 Tax=Oryza punctata TaxID=4537 RepID=A0A0E0L2U7_ORYPU